MPIFGISIVPSATRGSAARGSAGGLSGFGNVSGAADVVGAVVVDVDVDVLVVVDDVDVVGGVVEVVVVDLMVVEGSVATALALDLSSPHEAMTNRAAQPIAIALRRIPQSASEIHRCNIATAACWPERMHAGMPMPW
jgi:hypothetical protein